MSLSSDLISQFVKATKDTTATKKEETVFGTVVNKRDDDGRTWVKLDGSGTTTPVTTTADVENGERVTVLVKDHTATITGNKSSPSARKETVDNLGRQVEEFDVVLAYQVNAEEINAAKATIDELKAISAKFAEADINNAAIENLYAKFSELEHVSAKDAEILNAEIESLRAEFAKIEDLSVEDFNAANAKIDTLIGYTADFTYVSADRLHAIVAQIKNFNANYANIDFANITEAAIKKLFTDAGIIKDLVVSEGTITGELVGVTISGDLIKANTLKADKLVVKGSDGLYYKLNIEAGAVASAEVTKEELQNGLHGTAIIAKTITAEKIRVDDLVAFGATIGGFHLTRDKTTGHGSIYSDVKSSVDNTTRGIYLDNDGQVAFGDASNYVKFYKGSDDKYKLDVSADSIRLASSNTTVESIAQKADAANTKVDGMSELLVGTDGIQAQVSSMQDTVQKKFDGLDDTIAGISSTTNTMTATMNSTSFQVQAIQDTITNGVELVNTTSVTINNQGISIDKTGSDTWTRIDERGMKVLEATTETEVLVADSSGVDAQNLRATTFLIVGNNSRFEDYVGTRTGCFWIGN